MDGLVEMVVEMLFSRQLKFSLWRDTKGWDVVKG